MSREQCECRRCIGDRGDKTVEGLPVLMCRMVVCQKCGNKRCPHATDHRETCTNSNEPGQAGSYYK